MEGQPGGSHTAGLAHDWVYSLSSGGIRVITPSLVRGDWSWISEAGWVLKGSCYPVVPKLFPTKLPRNVHWICVGLVLLAAVGLGAVFAWAEITKMRECASLVAEERSELMFPLAGQIDGYRRNHQRFPDDGPAALKLLRASTAARIADADFYKRGSLVWVVVDGKPKPLPGGKGLICWFANPRYLFYTAAVVMDEKGLLSAEIMPIRDVDRL